MIWKNKKIPQDFDLRSCGIAILEEKQKINSVTVVSGRLAVNIESRNVGGR